MASFLTRHRIIYHFERLLKEAKREIMMVVPFIDLSDEIIDSLKDANKRGIEIIIVYKENKLTKQQKDILISFNNITLLHHPHVHAKFYANEFSVIVCSMNLYEHSLKNNREMGVLFDFFDDKDPDEGDSFSWNDDSKASEEAFMEVREIIQSSEIEVKSAKVKRDGFHFDLLKTAVERYKDFVSLINKKLDNKVFTVENDAFNFPVIKCKNYYENIDLTLDFEDDIDKDKEEVNVITVKRIGLHFNFPEKQRENLYKSFSGSLSEYKYKHFKVYWNYHKSPLLVYRDKKNYGADWNKIPNEATCVKGLIKGVDEILKDLKKQPLFKKIY